MKKVYSLLVFGLLMVMGLGTAKAQVVDVCAGNDTVVLRLGNFQYGYVQWQVSDDNETWQDIDGAIDTVYRFLPERPKYYRAEVRFPQCSEYNYYSQVSYVQTPPKAFAGSDIDAPANVPFRLCASAFEDAEGEWSVIEGANGMLDDVNDPHSMFIGSEGEYKLVWSLTNSCGVSYDTVNINCVAMEYNNKLFIVDETDVILSDTLQMLNGEYAIVFTDTLPEITEGTVLLGYREKPFMRKVTSVEMVGDVFVMQTEQAAISDIIFSGAMCLDPIDDLGDIDSTRMKVLERYPTRKEMAADPFLLRDGGVYFVKGKERWKDKGISISVKKGKLTTKVSVNLSVFHPSLNGLELELSEVWDPNFRADINLRDDGELAKFYMGFYNEKITKTYKLKASKQVTATGIDWEGYLNPQQLIVGGFMVGLVPTLVTIDFPISGSITASLQGLEVGYTTEWTGTHAIEWRDEGLIVIDTTEPVKKTWEPFNITGHLDAKIGLGMRLGVMLFDALGPTATVKGTFGPELCLSITPPNTLTADLAWGVDLDLACRLQAFSNKIGTNLVGHDFHLFRGSEFAPSKLLCAGGDQQVYNHLDFDFIQSGGFLPEYIKVNTKGWFGSNMPFALVHFEPEEGGEVSEEVVIANAQGIASVRWKPGLTAGHHRLKARAYDCDGNQIKSSPLVIHAYTEGTGDCWNSGLTADFVEHVAANGAKTVELLVTGGTDPYEYSTDATNYQPMLQTVGFTPHPGQSYVYYVRDAFGCETEAYYNEPFYDCRVSTLGLNVQVVNGNTIKASVLGGFSPYWFSIDDVTFAPGFNGQYSFPNLIDGTYDVTVRDAMGCVQTKTVVIEREANVGLSIEDAGYDLYGNPTGTVRMMASVQAIYDRGLCWCVKTDAGVMPTVYDFRLSYGSGSDDYGFTLQGLDSQKTYYVRAYVLCDAGTAYSNVIEMTPQYIVEKPFVSVVAVNAVMSTSASCSSNVVNDGHSPVTERGFCWSANNPNPSLEDNHKACDSGAGVFSSRIIGLRPNTTYYVRAYATNSVGTAYGLVGHFTTLPQGDDENLVFNGDFELGNVGFETDYHSLQTGGFGCYSIDDDAYNVWNSGHWYGYGGSGLFMIVDGADWPNAVVWKQIIEVNPNTLYSFSTQIVSLCNSAIYTQAQLQFLVNDVQIGNVFNAPSTLYLWQEFQASWNSGNATTAEIKIIDLNSSGDGNDFGLDNIYFGTATPGGGDTHEYVDLGLPSGLLWATCNVGANAPEEYGDYFAWGETTPKSDYNWNNYIYCNEGNSRAFVKYNNDYWSGYNGFTDDLSVLLPEDDAATVHWGGNWRMPTKEELLELVENTTYVWTVSNGVKGMLVTGENGNSIFLPATGAGNNISQGVEGRFWTSSLGTGSSNGAFLIAPRENSFPIVETGRASGNTVRPVRSAILSEDQPRVTTSEVIEFTTGTAMCGGMVINDGGTIVVERGVCWGTRHNPTLNDFHISAGEGLGDFTVNVTGLVSSTIYYVRTYATNSLGTVYGNEVSFKTLTGVNNHEYVDLGLPSGTLWATCNVGADAPEGYGAYFAWGETQTKERYKWDTYKYCNEGNPYRITKYCDNSEYGNNGFIDNLTVLLPEDDAAVANWGDDWRMPTQEEWQELLDYTTHTWTIRNGVRGNLFTAGNGNSLFLPAAGNVWNDEVYFAGSFYTYWSSSLKSVPCNASCFIGRIGYSFLVATQNYKSYGANVRPVRSSHQN